MLTAKGEEEDKVKGLESQNPSVLIVTIYNRCLIFEFESLKYN